MFYVYFIFFNILVKILYDDNEERRSVNKMRINIFFFMVVDKVVFIMLFCYVMLCFFCLIGDFILM